MVKQTKRKGFNFFRSYFDVYNELSDKDKLQFIDALLNRQFLGVKPECLNGMAKFAYISQTNSIDSQVKGYEDKTGTKLNICTNDGVLDTPSLGGTQGGTDTPSLQVEEKEKEKVEYTIDFDLLLKFINKKTKRKFNKINSTVRAKYNARLKDGYTKADIFRAVEQSVKEDYNIKNNFKYLKPEYYSRANTLDLFAETTTQDIKPDLNDVASEMLKRVRRDI